MNILLLASHAVAEYDDLRMFTDLGYDVFAPGGYEVPSRSAEGIRPALPDAPHHPELVARCNDVRTSFHSPPGRYIDWAKARLHDDLIDWADVIICHHFPDVWIGEQWERIKHKRVIWRTCGQSNPGLEGYMAQFAGLQVVRYSPAEQRHFERLGSFAGQDAMIRFGKYPGDYGPWVGDRLAVGNLTQDLVERGDSCGYGFWQAATAGLPTLPAGKGSEAIGGLGLLSYDAMLNYLRSIRVYLYTGTRPASYTLGLIEAMLSGVPVVSIGPYPFGVDWDGGDLFEAWEIARWAGELSDVRRWLGRFLDDFEFAANESKATRGKAVDLFSVQKIGREWRAFLG